MRNGSATTEAWTGLVNNDINYVWNHGRKFEGGFHCRYCNLRSRGGGATRFMEHLGHVIGEVKECPNVPRNICDAMKGARNATRQKKREKATRKLRIERCSIWMGLSHESMEICGRWFSNVTEDRTVPSSMEQSQTCDSSIQLHVCERSHEIAFASSGYVNSKWIAL
ncbi:hypothetical protein QYE76_005984 [Lolium multiflorum]|uniref:BED-type domain-containing protein n=1 Tax=Lolium multiflorum TaxID=4521 RepID=A0AAD8W2U0_LOLMU|nr:hypothetical protein QYE76_005984 [Lolium multiflorum]